jgi:hypothetical protein
MSQAVAKRVGSVETGIARSPEIDVRAFEL